MGIPSARRNIYDTDGYIPTSSEERIATGGAKDGQWGYGKNTDTFESSDADLELGKGYTTTRLRGGNDDGGAVGIAIERKESAEWDHERADLGKEGQIVKTVHINQYASDR